jgi:PAS domain S-box-containing protein
MRAGDEPDEHYRTLVEQIRDHAVYRTDTMGRPTTWNEGVRNVLGFEEGEFIGHHITPCIFTPEDVEAGVPELELQEAAEKGRSSDDRWMRRKDGTRIWAAGMTYALYDKHGGLTGFSKVLRDLTEWKRAREKDQFLLALESAIRPLVDPDQIVATATRHLGEHLQVRRCIYVNIEDDENAVRLVDNDKTRAAGLVGQHALAQFGPDFVRRMRAGDPFVVIDSEEDPRCATAVDSYRQAAIRSLICVPLHKAGGPVAALAVHDTTLRPWREDEVELLQTVAARCWESIERARILQDLHELNNQLEQRVNDRTREVVAFQDKLRAMATQLNLAEQRERKRLAEELHDHLQQMLALGRFKLGRFQGVPSLGTKYANLINELDEIFASALSYTRTMVAELCPLVMHDKGLPSGLRWLAENMKQHHLNVELIGAEDTSLQLPEDQAILVFQSVRELLINVTKHARTTNAWVSISVREDTLQIEVRDRGIGFDSRLPVNGTSGSQSSPSFGLFSIRERMKALGGSLTIESMPAQGTTATILLPLAAPNGQAPLEHPTR